MPDPSSARLIPASEARQLREAATEGPWTATTAESIGGGLIYGADGWSVASASWSMRAGGLEPPRPEGGRRVDANAPLIAAAPDLAYTVERLEADRDALLVERDAWMLGVADVVEPFGFDREAACGPADLLPGLRWLVERSRRLLVAVEAGEAVGAMWSRHAEFCAGTSCGCEGQAIELEDAANELHAFMPEVEP